MKIVIATPILYEASSPFNHLFKDIIGGFLEDGNNVIRLVAVENKDETDFKYGYESDKIEYRLYRRKKNNHKNIISRYVGDSITNIREAFGVLKLKNIDVLFEDVSYSSFWSVLAAKIKGLKVVVMLQDVWPDNAVQSNLINQKSVLYRYFEMWQRYVYKKADKIVCISDDMKEFIVSKGISSDKIEVIYNWGYSDEINNISWKDNKFVKKYHLNEDKFYVIYAGNIGKMQNVEIIVNAAKEIQHREDIQFLIIGDGAKKDIIAEMAQDLANITLLPMQSSEIATHIYSAAGVNVIPLVEGGTKTALPSKTGVILSCGKPVIACVDVDSCFASMISKLAKGVAVSPDDPKQLAVEISNLADNQSGEYSYQCFKKLFLREANVNKYKELINEL